MTAIAGDPQANIDFFTGILGLRLVKLTVNFDDPTTHHRSPRPNGPRSGGSHPEGPHRDGAARNDFRLGQQHPPNGQRTNEAWEFRRSVSTTPLWMRCCSPDEIRKIGGSNFLRVFAAAISNLGLLSYLFCRSFSPSIGELISWN